MSEWKSYYFKKTYFATHTDETFIDSTGRTFDGGWILIGQGKYLVGFNDSEFRELYEEVKDNG